MFTMVTTLDTNLLINIVKKILRKFDEWNLTKLPEKLKYNHLDVTLSKDGAMYHGIQITNYGQSADNALRFLNGVYNEFILIQCFQKDSLLATIYSKNECIDIQTVRDLRYRRKRLALSKSKSNDSFTNFINQKKYLSIQLKHKLISSELENFTRVIMDEIISLQRFNPQTKFTYHHNHKIIYNNHIPLDNDYRSCKILTTALTNVIQHSLNIEFKERCFSMLGVDNSHQVESALMTRLLPLIHENYTFSEGSSTRDNQYNTI